MSFSRLLRRSLSSSSSTAKSLTPTTSRFHLYRKRNLDKMAFRFKQYSKRDWFRAQTFVYEKTVKRLTDNRRLSLVRDILERQKRFEDFTNEDFAARIITLYGKARLFWDALKTFDELPERNCPRTAVSFNALLGACLNNSKAVKDIEKYFRELPSKASVTPDGVSYCILIKGFCKTGSFDLAISALDEMGKIDLVPDLVTFNTLLAGLYRKRLFEDGDKIRARMEAANVVPDVNTYNFKMIPLVEKRKMSEAVSAFQEMETKGIKADITSLFTLIKGFCKTGDLEEAKRYYEKIGAGGLTLDRLTCLTLLTLACKKGDLDLSVDLFKKAYELQLRVGVALLQLVIDGLVKESKVEAKKLLKLSNSKRFYRWYVLKMPSD